MSIPCIRYSRWSSGKQSDGNSRQRQALLVERWMADNPGAYLVDEAIDAGVSGWKGKHLGPEGELGRLVAAIEAGHYPAGTHLLVETVDRLGRLDFLGMMEPLGKILRGGVTVVLLETGQRYDREALNGPGMHAFAAAIQTAYAFSERLSRRVQAAWDERKRSGADGRAVGNRRLPLWLDRVGDEAVLNEPMAAFVAECLELYCSGMGYRKAMKLARERHPHMEEWEAQRAYGGRTGAKLRDAWLQHLIEKDVSVELLRGFWNGVKCYPAAIPEDLWHRVRQERRRRLEGSSRAIPSRQHFLTSIATCGVCNGTMNFKPARDKRVLFCGTRNREGIEACRNGQGIPEAVAVYLWRREASAWIERAMATRQTSPAMRRIIAIESELTEIAKGVTRLAAALAKFDDPAFESQMGELIAQRKALEAEKAQLQADEDATLAQLGTTLQHDAWHDSEHPSETLELGGLLRKAGFKMTCWPTGSVSVGDQPYQSLGWSRKELAYIVENDDERIAIRVDN